MKDVAFFAGSLIVIGLALAAVPSPLPWRLGGGGGLLILWAYGLGRAAGRGLHPASTARLLPGHALLFLALGLVGSQAGFWAWTALPLLSLLLDLVRQRSLATVMYAILWLDIFALLHQVVALGRNMTGLPFVLWSVGIALVAILYVTNGVRRRWRKGVIR
ncbi:MAG TPA: hypothetical protein ENN53_01650 [Candidatus Acetothermia bacterium]|nr:hypothetical protein [Candidatus Acetothermia bacterium]